jgi:hypothetical protein
MRKSDGAKSITADLGRCSGWWPASRRRKRLNSSPIAILLNRGDGSGFAPAREVTVGTGPFDIASGDLDRNRIPDLVVATPDAHAIDVLLMRADGRVASRSLVARGSESRSATLADVTRDGILDLIYSDYARNRVVLLAGSGMGGFDARRLGDRTTTLATTRSGCNFPAPSAPADNPLTGSGRQTDCRSTWRNARDAESRVGAGRMMAGARRTAMA